MFFPAIPWWLCLVLAVGCRVLARIFDREDERDIGTTRWPVFAGIARFLVLVLLVLGAINLWQRYL
jgi:hypothetical protein